MLQRFNLKKFTKKNDSHFPTFEEWDEDNCADKWFFGEPIMMPRETREVYNESLKSGFFDDDGPIHFKDGLVSFFWQDIIGT